LRPLLLPRLWPVRHPQQKFGMRLEYEDFGKRSDNGNDIAAGMWRSASNTVSEFNHAIKKPGKCPAFYLGSTVT
jgi:hypothetical protein